MEKVSEIDIRKALVDKIKESGLKEIEERKTILKERIGELDLKDTSDYAYFDLIIKELTSLNYLKEYLSGDTMFAYEWMVDGNVFYIIPIESLEIWLKDGVVTKYMSHLEVCCIEPTWLTDDFFGYKSKFITFFDKMAYETTNKTAI